MVRSPLQYAHLLLLLLPAASVACLGANASEDRQLAEMRKEISDVQGDGDKFEERLDKASGESGNRHPSMQGEGGALPPPPPPPPNQPPPIATPELPLVHQPPHGAERASTDDGKPAPILSFTNANIGSALASHPASPGLRVTARNDRD